MHTALYRKKRPKTFADLVGQPHVVKALTNQLATAKLSHAYLFCGTRGTGKTSAAKIFARAVNCETNKPCNSCAICQSILADRCMDVIEIDAASNNSVDNIRDLREEVRYPPTEAIHKVYIIDEVHMLSTSAFNALLKTLEEPPPHVIFILATTDPQKLPATILSRCQRYDFKRITKTDMVATMAKHMQAENTPYDEAALEQIAYHSDGAMRDALSLLDQCLAIGEGAVSLPIVLQVLGAVDRSVMFDFTDALAEYDSTKVLKVVDEAMTEGRDVVQFANDLVRHFRDVLVAGQGADLDYSAEIIQKLKDQGSHVPSIRLIEYIRAFSETLKELRFAPHMRTALEVCALRLCSPIATGANSGNLDLDGLMARLTKVEKNLVELVEGTVMTPEPKVSGIKVMPETAPPIIPDQIQEKEHVPAQSANSLTPQLLSQIQAQWLNMCNSLPPLIRSMLIRCSLEADGGTLKIISDNASEAKLLKDKNRPLVIREALAERFNMSTPPNLDFIVRESKQPTATKEVMPSFPSPPHEEPAHEPPPLTSPQEQMGWDDYGQQMEENTESPF